LIAGGCLYSFYRRGELTYWDGAVGNWIATLLGIIVGVPVALHLERIRSRILSAEAQRATLEQRAVVLRIVLRELGYIRDQISQRSSAADQLPVEPLKTSSWRAITANGSLKHVNPPALLERMADLYRWVDILNENDALVKRTAYGINPQFADGRFASTVLLEQGRHAHMSVFNTVSASIDMVRDELGDQAA
jgi:hypothetical protein